MRNRQDHVDVRLAKLAISSRLAAFSIGVFLRPLFPASVLCCSLTHALAGLRVVKSVSQAVSADAAGDDSTALLIYCSSSSLLKRTIFLFVAPS